jgi:hypothetical protein
LSVLVWNLVFDELLNIFKKGRIKIKGFADDAALLIQGRSLAIMYREMNKAIAKANQWAQENGLTLSPSKTIAVLFTRKTKYTIPKTPLKKGTKIIDLSSEAKYLGVFLDSKLNWKYHIENKIRQCTKYLFMIRGSVRTTWGPHSL